MSSQIALSYGGIAASKELAPAILFAVAYASLLPLATFRMIKKETRSLSLIRPTIFILVRITTMILRALMAKGNRDIGLIITAQVLLSIGFVFLIQPVITAFESHMTSFILDLQSYHDSLGLEPISHSSTRHSHKSSNETEDGIDENEHQKTQRHWVLMISKLLQIMTYVIIGLGIGTAIKMSDALDGDNSAAETVRGMSKALAFLGLVIVVILVLVPLYVQLTHHLVNIRNTVFISGVALLLTVVSAFKVSAIEITTHSAWVHSVSALYILLITFEWLATLSLFSIPFSQWFPTQKQLKKKIKENVDEQTTMSMRNELPA